VKDDSLSPKLIMGFFFPFLFLIVIPFLFFYSLKRVYQKDRHIGVEKEFFFSNEGFNFTFSQFYTWDCVEGAVESWFSFHLILPNKKIIIIPKHIFSDKPLRNDFKGLLKGEIDASKWKIENLKRKKQV
jgi:hypothetical protein